MRNMASIKHSHQSTRALVFAIVVASIFAVLIFNESINFSIYGDYSIASLFISVLQIVLFILIISAPIPRTAKIKGGIALGIFFSIRLAGLITVFDEAEIYSDFGIFFAFYITYLFAAYLALTALRETIK